MTELPSIPEFFRDKTVFITGGSGFIGKVLVEKLLRSCPDIKVIFLLMREKKGRSVEERIRTITDLPLFDLLKSQQPNAISKIHIVAGDVSSLGLALTPEDRKLLVEQVDVVFHAAASVRFDDALTDAILLNTRGTREVVQLALEMKKLTVFTHISTTYCHTDRKVIEEKLHPAHADWEKTIEIAENVDRNTLNVLTDKFIQPLVNTYTFTKSLSEHVVHDLCKGKVPTVVVRPSIVISTAREPVIGWIDNFNGPAGMIAGIGKGVIRVAYADPNIISDYVPVDILVRGIIIATWKQGIERDPERRLTPSFYNGSQDQITPVTVGQMVEMGSTICENAPLNDILWYPAANVTKCYYNYFLKVIFYHLLPALLVDGLLKLIGHKPLLVKIQRKVYVAIMALSYFTLNQWKFINTKAVNLEKELLPCDVDSFGYRASELEPLEYFTNAALGGKIYLLKEGDKSLEDAKRHLNRMWVLSQIFNALWYLGLIWIVFFKIDILSIIVNKCNEVYVFLTTD